MNTVERVKAVIGDVAGIAAAEIGDDQHLGELKGFDSLNWTEVVLDLEKHFGLDINDDVISDGKLDTAAKIAAWLDERKKPVDDDDIEEAVGDAVDTAVDILAAGAVVSVSNDDSRTNIHYRSSVPIEAIQFNAIDSGATLWNCNPLDIPAWLHEAMALPQGDPGSLWVDFDTSMLVLVGPTGAPSQVKPTDWLWRAPDSFIVSLDDQTFTNSFEEYRYFAKLASGSALIDHRV